MLSARPERTQECIFTAPLGISRLVAVLDDRREVIRNEGLLLLTTLTPSSAELQKLVAFENAFDRTFGLIKSEGALTHGGIVIQDCLSLLANLLRLNVSNQSFFRETGCVPKLAELIRDAVADQDSDEGVADWAKPQRDKNLWGVLAIVRLFLIPGGLGSQANQVAFWQSGILSHVLQLAFSHSTEVAVKAEVRDMVTARHLEAILTVFAGPHYMCRPDPRQREAPGGLCATPGERCARRPALSSRRQGAEEWRQHGLRD